MGWGEGGSGVSARCTAAGVLQPVGGKDNSYLEAAGDRSYAAGSQQPRGKDLGGGERVQEVVLQLDVIVASTIRACSKGQ